MAIIDWVILIIVVLSVMSAAKAGLVLEVFTLAGLILGLLVASWDYEKLTPWMSQWIHTPALSETLSFYCGGAGRDGIGRHSGQDGSLVGEVSGLELGRSAGGSRLRSGKGMRSGDDRGDGDCRILAGRNVVPAVAPGTGVYVDSATGRGCGSGRTGRSDPERGRCPAEGAARLDETGCVIWAT